MIAISFLFIFLSANTALRQVLLLPVLVQHYLEHVEKDNLTLLEFLSEHYAKTITHPDNKFHDHQKLPFKTADCHTSQMVVLIPQSSFSISHLLPKSVEDKNPIHKQQHYSNAYLNSIWQPPRFS